MDIRKLFSSQFENDGCSCEPQVVAGVPGVVRFLGDFADISKGCSLCGTVNHRTELCVGQCGGNQVTVSIVSPSGNAEKRRFSTVGIKYRHEDKLANCIKGAFWGISRKHSQTVTGCNVLVSGDNVDADNEVTHCSVVLCAVAALNCLFSLKLPKSEIAAAVFDICTVFCGIECSYTQIITMIQSEQGEFLFFDMADENYVKIHNPFPSSEAALLLVRCPVPVSYIHGEFFQNKAVESSLFKLKKTAYFSSVAEIGEGDVLDRENGLDERSRRILLHTVEDFRIAGNAVRALKTVDYRTFGRMMSRIQKSIADNLEISVPEMDWVIKRAVEIPECYGAVAVSSGVRGFVAVLIDRNSVEKFTSKMTEYDRIFGSSADVVEYSPLAGLEVTDLRCADTGKNN